MYSGKGDDFSRRMAAQILGVFGDMYGQRRVLPRCEEFVKRDQGVMVLDTRDVRCLSVIKRVRHVSPEIQEMWRSIVQAERSRQVMMPIQEPLGQSLRLLPRAKINGPFSIR